LVRAVFKSAIPIISAIGHETDTTLIDYVADLRAPTPTASAELATPVLEDLKNSVNFLGERLRLIPQNLISEKHRKISDLKKYLIDPRLILQRLEEKFFVAAKKLEFFSQNLLKEKFTRLASKELSSQFLSQKILSEQQKNEFLFDKLKSHISSTLKQQESNLENLTKLLQSNNYHQIVKRGFAVIRDASNNPISSISEVKLFEKISIEMNDGTLSANVLPGNPDKLL
jgi:exodeoxyribonuclease VII large subunit